MIRHARWSWPLILLVVGWWSECRAELRTWTAAVGGFKTEAEFIELRDGTVHLRLANGDERAVPLSKLSSPDQDYARSQARKSAGPKSDRLARLEKEAGACNTAEEAVRLYRVFRADPQTTESERQASQVRFEELTKLAAQKMVRIGSKWVTEEAFQQRRDKANSLMKQGLELLRLKQEDAFRAKFAEAAKVEPELVRADFMIGMLYSMLSSNYTKSKQYFEICAKHDPDNVAVLNNLALACMRHGDMALAMANWRKAVKLEANQCIVQNLGRLIDQAAKKKLNVPKPMLDMAVNMYSTLLSTEKFQRADLKRGWMWMFIDEESMSLARNEKGKTVESTAPKPAEDGSVVIGGGTGFVVFPHYVLTNRHVVAKGTSFDLQTSDGGKDRLLRATLVATSEKPDLALLKCDELAAAPVTIDPSPLGRGTDIMTLGYPEMFVLGASLKATRGVISAIPSSAVDDMYLYDAIVNHGNSGGPVCDHHGNVVAVTTIMTNTEGKYGGGIPSAAALGFVQQHVPGFTQPQVKRDVLDWPTVDQRVSPATVLVWARSKTPGSNPALANAGIYEDRDCLVCNALGVLKCGAVGCVGGVVTVRQGTRIATAACPHCGGKSLVKCPICSGTGIDPELQRPGEVPTPEPAPAPPNNGIAGGGPDNRSIGSRSRRPPFGRSGPGIGGPSTRSSGPSPNPAADPRQQPDEGDFGAWNGQKLDEAVAAKVRTAISSNTTLDTQQLGTGNQPYRDVNRNGALLIGLHFTYGHFGSKPTIGALRPIFLTSAGRDDGEWHGARAAEGRHIIAKPGYAVGAVRIRPGLGVDSLQVVFMRVQGDRLDPADSYESPLYGGPGGGGQITLGGDGSFIVGIFGKTPNDPRSTFNGLGLVTVPRVQ